MSSRIALKILLFCFITGHALYAGELIISGVYQGKSLYVQNPFTEDTKSFCTQEVYINDKMVLDNPQSSAYMVDLSKYKINDFVIIRIIHRNDCEPKVINPQVIRRKADFAFTSMELTKDKLTWTTQGEIPNSRLFIEQFINNKWVIIKALPAKGRYDENFYEYVPSIGSGSNSFRLKMLTPQGAVLYSRIVAYNSEEPPVTFRPARVTDRIFLSRATKYAIFDAQGNLLKKGTGETIDCSELTAGLYYLNFDNKTEKFLKK